MHGLLAVSECLMTITAPAVVTGRAGGDAIFMRCMWRAGIGGTDAGTVMEGPLQLVDRLEWWDFRASSSLDMMQHEDFDRGWRRSIAFNPLPRPTTKHQTPTVSWHGAEIAAPLSRTR